MCIPSCQPALDRPPPPAQGTFCLNARATNGWGALGSGRAWPAVRPSRPRWKTRMSETKAISSAARHKLGCPALTGAPTCESPEVCGSQNPGSTYLGGRLAVGGAGGGGTASPCIRGLGKPDSFMSQGRPLLKFHLSCSGPQTRWW